MWSDTESEKDYLNFGEVSQLAVDILKTDGMLPVSIGVFGNWGAGKSSLLKLIEQNLEKNEKNWIVINFDAWLYQGYDDARAALLEVIATALTKAADGNASLATKAKKLLARVDGFRALGFLAEGVAMFAGIPTGGLLARSVGALGNAAGGIQDQKEYESLGNTAKEAKEQVGGLLKPESKKARLSKLMRSGKNTGKSWKSLAGPWWWSSTTSIAAYPPIPSIPSKPFGCSCS